MKGKNTGRTRERMYVHRNSKFSRLYQFLTVLSLLIRKDYERQVRQRKVTRVYTLKERMFNQKVFYSISSSLYHLSYSLPPPYTESVKECRGKLAGSLEQGTRFSPKKSLPIHSRYHFCPPSLPISSLLFCFPLTTLIQLSSTTKPISSDGQLTFWLRLKSHLSPKYTLPLPGSFPSCRRGRNKYLEW